ncbi:MAG: hypothetical protein EA416_06745 [Trueperaceae bacterium]|nr:MAG: hypothetical protein EA416_06745 [Trueperaceae bacterium]
MKGTEIILNGDRWTVVDVAPAMPLADMVAALLEDEGFVATVRVAAGVPDVLTHLGVTDSGTTVVLVPSVDAERALALIDETVTDYSGDDLDAALAELSSDPNALGEVDTDEAFDDEDDFDDDDDADIRRLDAR